MLETRSMRFSVPGSQFSVQITAYRAANRNTERELGTGNLAGRGFQRPVT
jgi:hypothetical protein